MKRVIAFMLALISCSFLFAQNHTCFSDEVHQSHIKADTSYATWNAQLEKEILQTNQTHSISANDTIITIPVVFHIIHKGEKIGTGSNVSDSVVYAALQGANDRFSGKLGASIDTKIRFCLAVRDPDGNYTSGINRVDGRVVKGFDSLGMNLYINQPGGPEKDVKDLSKWPTTEYYNIWVVHRVNGAGGFAYFPTTTVNPYDGTVVNAPSMSYLNGLLTHELGHGLNLYHVFNQVYSSCPSTKDCATKGDLICDTPPTVDLGSGYCQEYNPCSSTYPWENTRYNYMNYCNNNDRFTEGQIDRMRASIHLTVRDSLLYSKACIPGHNDDAGVTQLLVCDSTIQAVIKNYGANQISKLNVHLASSDTVQSTYNWTGRLRTYQTDTILFAKNILMSDSGLNVSAFTDKPNGNSDTINVNDSVFYKNLYQPLTAGTYTVGGSKPDYKSLSDMADALNERGVCGPVTFNIRTGTYTDQIRLRAIRGVDAVNTVTIQSEKQNKDSVIIQYPSNSPNDNYVIDMIGTDKIHVNHITFNATGSAYYTNIIKLSEQACDNEFRHCSFNGQYLIWSSSLATALIHSSRSLDSGNVFKHNTFTYGGFGIYAQGIDPIGIGFTIDSNLFVNQINTAIYLQTVNAPKVRNNIITSQNNLFEAMNISTSGDELEITRNHIYGKIRGGISLYNCNSRKGKTNLVANNLIRISSDFTSPCIHLRQCNKIQILHNTLERAGTDSSSKVFYGERSNSMEVKNNIFANTSRGYAAFYDYVDFENNDIDNNDLYTTSEKLVFDKQLYSKLFLWGIYSKMDKHSISIDPQFKNDSTYHVCSVDLNRAGVYVSTTPKDIEENARRKVSPSIGALEIYLQKLDLASDRHACDSMTIDSRITGDVIWNTGDTTSKLWVNKPGNYIAEYNGDCGVQKDTVFIHLSYTPTADLGNDTLVCNSFQLEVPADTMDYLWSTGDTTNKITVDATNLYWVKVSNRCGVAIDSIDISMDSIPSFSLGNDTSSCEPIWLDGKNLSNTVWSDGSKGSQYLVDTTGVYWATASSKCGSATDTIMVTIHPTPEIALGNDTAGCDSVRLTELPKQYQYNWNTGDTTNQLTISNTGYYQTTVTNEFGCEFLSDSIYVVVHPSPTPNIGNDTTIKKGESIVIVAEKTYKTYQWSNGSGNSSLTLLADNLDSVQQISLTVTDDNGCMGSDSIILKVVKNVSIARYTHDGLHVYPNPTSNYLIVERPSELLNCFVNFYDATGKNVAVFRMNEGNSMLDVSTLKPGLYTVTINDKNQNTRSTVKILIE